MRPWQRLPGALPAFALGLCALAPAASTANEDAFCASVVDDPRAVRGEHYALTFAPMSPPWKEGTPHTVEIRVCTLSRRPFDGTVRADADMPAHRHGMNYRVTVTPVGAGRFSAAGFLFHMPGRWLLRFRLSGAEGSERLSAEIGL